MNVYILVGWVLLVVQCQAQGLIPNIVGKKKKKQDRFIISPVIAWDNWSLILPQCLGRTMCYWPQNCSWKDRREYLSEAPDPFRSKVAPHDSLFLDCTVVTKAEQILNCLRTKTMIHLLPLWSLSTLKLHQFLLLCHHPTMQYDNVEN
jgi:hypothetical protein